MSNNNKTEEIDERNQGLCMDCVREETCPLSEMGVELSFINEELGNYFVEFGKMPIVVLHCIVCPAHKPKQ